MSCCILTVGYMSENIPLILQTQKTEIIGMCWRNTKKSKNRNRSQSIRTSIWFNLLINHDVRTKERLREVTEIQHAPVLCKGCGFENFALSWN